MTEEEIQALKNATVAAETRAVEAEALANSAREEADKAKGDVTRVVDELKEERLKKNEAIDKAKLLNKDETDVSSLIEAALQSRDTKTRETSFIEALEEFKNSKSEFKSDTTGLVSTKFEADLKRFNFSDVGTKEQMKARLEEAYRFLNFKPGQQEENNYGGGSFNAAPANENTEDTLKNVEKVLEATGMDEERFKQLREKYPGALSTLGIN